ncbi:uncharacterized protein LOC108115391 [Drosophila eugracilis]|uniref:uncharacterized protein LOC108115391 n=1 Tax=Drosophila eugracilis TaxID=29029 RepID=UPI001BDA0D4D|nr:uncharacterized protein LOC108115391 [Drosophila eugracilis]
MSTPWPVVVSLFLISSQVLADLSSDAQMLEKCLREVSSPESIADDLQKLERYPSWTREELPCLMRCLAREKGWFDIEANKWKLKQLTEELGADVYNYCRYELRRMSTDGCTFAYRGLRCLKQAEMHGGSSLSTLLQCSRQLNSTNVQLLQYSKMKLEEPIPCLFQCFADAMGFYDSAGNWRLDNWKQAFGPTENEDKASTPDYSGYRNCRLSEKERQKANNKCSWMYQEYMCWERVNGNLQGVENRGQS